MTAALVPLWEDDAETLDADPANAPSRRGTWDVVAFDGQQLPGAATVTVRQGRKIDDRSGPGRNGARLVDKGAEAAKVTLRLRIWTQSQLDRLSDLMPSLNYRVERATVTRQLTTQQALDAAFSERAAVAGRSAEYRRFFAATGSMVPILPTTRRETVTRRDRAPVAIMHFVTALAGITHVYVEKIEFGDVEGGVLTVTFECLEFNPEIQRRSQTRAPTTRTQGSIADAAVTAPFRPSPPSTSNAAP